MLESREYVNKVLVGDSREILKTLPDKIFQTCITSPPYWGLRDYGVEGQIGLEDSIEKYVEEIVAIFREVRRTLRDDGTLWMNYGDTYWNGGSEKRDSVRDFVDGGKKKLRAADGALMQRRSSQKMGLKPKDLCGIPWRVAFALQGDGWYLRCDIIWSKPNPMPESVTDRPTKAHEYIFLMSKKPRYYYDADAIREQQKQSSIERAGFPDGKRMTGVSVPLSDKRWNVNERKLDERGANKRSVWEITTQPFKEAHFATFPEALVNPCILAGTPEVGCCAACGAPRKRIVEASGGTIGEDWHDHKDDLQVGNRSSDKTRDGTYSRKTIGWKPGCNCKSEVRPALVLDPFGGSGTVGYRAKQMGRAFTLIELNPEYAKMAERRMIQEVLL